MTKRKKHLVVIISHPDEDVYCWGKTSGMELIGSCLSTHPEEEIKVSAVEMTEAQFDALDDYTGEC